MRERCDRCGEALAGLVRVTASTRFCSKRCRQQEHDWTRQVQVLNDAGQQMRFAYADPPYRGRARRYYRDHADYRGEVDHEHLLRWLAAPGRYHGWGLSVAADSLQDVLVMADSLDLRLRVCPWVRGARGGRTRRPRSSVEYLLLSGGREEVRDDWCEDSLVFGARPTRSDPQRVIGAKPPRFGTWLFALLGARAGDELADLFPGSGAVGRAWGASGGLLLPEVYDGQRDVASKECAV